MKMEQTECSETSAYKIQTPGNYPKESIQHSVHGESLKSRRFRLDSVESKKLGILSSRVTVNRLSAQFILCPFLNNLMQSKPILYLLYL